MNSPSHSNDDGPGAEEHPSGFYRVGPGGRFERVEDPRPEPFDWTRERESWSVSQIAQAMARTGVSVGASTVRAWCETGLLKATKTSARGHYRVTSDRLRAFLNGDDSPTPAHRAA